MGMPLPPHQGTWPQHTPMANTVRQSKQVSVTDGPTGEDQVGEAAEKAKESKSKSTSSSSSSSMSKSSKNDLLKKKIEYGASEKTTAAMDSSQLAVAAVDNVVSRGPPFPDGSALSFIPQTPPEDIPPEEGPTHGSLPCSSAVNEIAAQTLPPPDASLPPAAPSGASGAAGGSNESQSISKVPIGSGLGIGIGSAGGRKSPPSVLPKKDDEDEEFLALKRPRPPPKAGKISFNVEGAKQAVAAAQAVKEAEAAVEALRAKRLNTRDASSQTEFDPLKNNDYVALWRLRPRGMASFPHFPRQANGKKHSKDRKIVGIAVTSTGAERAASNAACEEDVLGARQFGQDMPLLSFVEAEHTKDSGRAAAAVIEVDE